MLQQLIDSIAWHRELASRFRQAGEIEWAAYHDHEAEQDRKELRRVQREVGQWQAYRERAA